MTRAVLPELYMWSLTPIDLDKLDLNYTLNNSWFKTSAKLRFKLGNGYNAFNEILTTVFVMCSYNSDTNAYIPGCYRVMYYDGYFYREASQILIKNGYITAVYVSDQDWCIRSYDGYALIETIINAMVKLENRYSDSEHTQLKNAGLNLAKYGEIASII